VQLNGVDNMKAAIVGLVGVILGAAISTARDYLLAARKEAAEKENWRRDRCLEAYSEIISAVEAAISVAAVAYGAPCGSDEHSEQRRVVFEKVAEMNRLSGRVILIAPESVKVPFSSLSTFITTDLLIMAIQCPKASPDERKAANTKLSGLLATFMTMAAHDIGIHPILGPVERTRKPWWKF
jgi:hypothetical protein